MNIKSLAERLRCLHGDIACVDTNNTRRIADLLDSLCDGVRDLVAIVEELERQAAAKS
jgi:hypothetical protein